MQVRVAVAEDLDEVVRLERETELRSALGRYGKYATMVKDVGEVRRRLLVAERGDELVGFAVGKVVRIGDGAGG